MTIYRYVNKDKRGLVTCDWLWQWMSSLKIRILRILMLPFNNSFMTLN